jgi:type I restriction-modification system DNA methylase subunit
MPKEKTSVSKSNGSNLDFEAQLWAAADKMRGHMDASEYNGARPEGLCLGLIFPEACLKIAWGPAARDFGGGQGGESGASPQRAVTVEPTPVTGKRPAARRGFGEKAGWLRCASVGDRCGYPLSLRLAIQPFPPKQDAHGIFRPAPEYISDAFEEKREQLLFGFSDPKGEWFIKDEPQRADAAEGRVFSLSASIGERAGVRCRCPQLPPEARWHTTKAKAKSPEIGKVIDDAMGAIERENSTLKGVLPRDYARPSLDKVRLGGLVDISSNIGFNESAAKSKVVLGRVYEYFLGKFASAEGKGGGEFYTPQCVVQVLVAMLEPYKGRVFETLQSANVKCNNRQMNRRRIRSVRGQRWPCASTSGGMFVSSEKFVEEHGGRVGDIAVYGQESNYTTWKLARMNLAIRGIDANLGLRNADSMMSSKSVSNFSGEG